MGSQHLVFHSDGLGEGSGYINLHLGNVHSKYCVALSAAPLQQCAALLEGTSWISYSWQAGSTRRAVCSIDLKLPDGGWELIKLEL